MENSNDRVYAVKAGGSARDFGAVQWKRMNTSGWTQITKEEYLKIKSGAATGATFTPPEIGLKKKEEQPQKPAKVAEVSSVAKVEDLTSVNDLGAAKPAAKAKAGKSATGKTKAAAGKTLKK